MSQGEPLVAIYSDNWLLIEPIWEKPVDEIEGPLYQEYIKGHPSYNEIFVRKSVANMLEQASKSLDGRYRLILRAGHRPLDVQYKLLAMVKDSYKADNSQASEQEALEFARTFVSDPSIKLPPHCCGAAVDVDMIERKTGQLIDFGCPVNTDDEISFLNTDKINTEQRANRDMLHKVMLEAGFAPYDYEWWHFSYGDTTWAKFYNRPKSIYGLIEP